MKKTNICPHSTMINFISKVPLIAIFMIIAVLWSCEDENGEEEECNENVVTSINAQVNAITFDKTNTMWIATDTGLYKSVDGGYVFKDLKSNGEIYSLFYEESSDLLWMGTAPSLLKVDISKCKISEESVPNENLNNPRILSIHVDNNSRHWFGSEKGLNLFYNNKWKKDTFRIGVTDIKFKSEFENHPISSIASLGSSYYFATKGSKVWRAYDYDEEVDAFTGATQWDPPYNGENITDTMFVVFIDKEGIQWMGGTDGLQGHMGDNPKESFAYFNDELPDPYVLAINQAPDSTIWVGTRKGICIIDVGKFETSILTEGLPDLHVTAIAFDQDGIAWVGTKKGLVKIE